MFTIMKEVKAGGNHKHWAYWGICSTPKDISLSQHFITDIPQPRGIFKIWRS